MICEICAGRVHIKFGANHQAAKLATRSSIFDSDLHVRDVEAHWLEKTKRQDANVTIPLGLINGVLIEGSTVGNYIDTTLDADIDAGVAAAFRKIYAPLNASLHTLAIDAYTL